MSTWRLEAIAMPVGGKLIFALNGLPAEDFVLFKLRLQHRDLCRDLSPLAIRFTRASDYFLLAKAFCRLLLGFLCEPGRTGEHALGSNVRLAQFNSVAG